MTGDDAPRTTEGPAEQAPTSRGVSREDVLAGAYQSEGSAFAVALDAYVAAEVAAATGRLRAWIEAELGRAGWPHQYNGDSIHLSDCRGCACTSRPVQPSVSLRRVRDEP
jgi:hypothetical protein